MKKVLAVAVVLGVLTAFGLGVTIASAQSPTPAPGAPGFGPMRGYGVAGGTGWNADWYTKAQEAVAKALGMTVDQLNAEYRAGKTLAQIAQAKNVSLEKLHDAMEDVHKAALQQAVKDGKLTQAQADAILARMDAMDKYWDTNAGACPGSGFAPQPGFAPRGGMMRGGFTSSVPPQNFRRPMGGWR